MAFGATRGHHHQSGSFSTRSYTDGLVAAGTTYQYTMTVSNLIGVSAMTGPVSTIAAATPSSPSSVTATADSSQVLISWNLPTSNGGIGSLGFNVYRSTGADWTLLCTLNDPTTVSCRDQTVLSGVAYQYCVAAFNPIGEGPRAVDQRRHSFPAVRVQHDRGRRGFERNSEMEHPDQHWYAAVLVS